MNLEIFSCDIDLTVTAITPTLTGSPGAGGELASLNRVMPAQAVSQ